MALRSAWPVGLLLVAGCTGTDDPDIEELPGADAALEECVEAVADVSEASEDGDLWPAFGNCASLEDFVIALEETGAELPAGTEPETYVVDLCAQTDEIDPPELCDSL